MVFVAKKKKNILAILHGAARCFISLGPRTLSRPADSSHGQTTHTDVHRARDARGSQRKALRGECWALKENDQRASDSSLNRGLNGWDSG